MGEPHSTSMGKLAAILVIFALIAVFAGLILGWVDRMKASRNGLKAPEPVRSRTVH